MDGITHLSFDLQEESLKPSRRVQAGQAMLISDWLLGTGTY